jgi:hypothetical protein
MSSGGEIQSAAGCLLLAGAAGFPMSGGEIQVGVGEEGTRGGGKGREGHHLHL